MNRVSTVPTYQDHRCGRPIERFIEFDDEREAVPACWRHALLLVDRGGLLDADQVCEGRTP
jgi:hypothetical protein